jgi:hypothetical protein
MKFNFTMKVLIYPLIKNVNKKIEKLKKKIYLHNYISIHHYKLPEQKCPIVNLTILEFHLILLSIDLKEEFISIYSPP